LFFTKKRIIFVKVLFFKKKLPYLKNLKHLTMRTFLTFLIIWIGVYGYAYTKPNVAPSPQFRYINLELQRQIPNKSQPIYYENYHHNNHPQQQIYRDYSSISLLPTNLPTKSEYTTQSSTILVPFSDAINEGYPIPNISTRDASDWGDGLGDEPGLDPYPIGEGLSFLFLCILIYTMISIKKKRLPNKNPQS